MNHPYELLSYNVRLSFADVHGLEAKAESYRQVRSSSSELACVSEHIWGAGDQLKAQTTIGAEFVQVLSRGRFDMLISTPAQTVREHEVIEIYSARQIHHGFKERREAWEYRAFTPTDRVRVAVSFPLGRDPYAITVGVEPGTPSPFVARPGTKEIVMSIKSPTIGSLYRIEWSW